MCPKLASSTVLCLGLALIKKLTTILLPVEHFDDVVVGSVAVLGVVAEEDSKGHHHVLHSKP